MGAALLTRCALLLLVGLSGAARAEGEDRWWGEDKALHFGVSLAFPTTGYAAGTALFDDGQQGLLLGASAGLAAGVAKELYDLSGRGTPSFRDLAWDGLGLASGLALTWAVDQLFFARERELRRRGAAQAPPGRPRTAPLEKRTGRCKANVTSMPSLWAVAAMPTALE